MQINSDNITSIDGVVNVSAIDIVEEIVDLSPIKKENLYNQYIEHKNIYDSGVNNVEQAALLTTEHYEFMMSEAYN